MTTASVSHASSAVNTWKTPNVFFSTECYCVKEMPRGFAFIASLFVVMSSFVFFSIASAVVACCCFYCCCFYCCCCCCCCFCSSVKTMLWGVSILFFLEILLLLLLLLLLFSLFSFASLFFVFSILLFYHYHSSFSANFPCFKNDLFNIFMIGVSNRMCYENIKKFFTLSDLLI